MSWLPDDFAHPLRVLVPGTALHLRPIRESDTALDHPAVMGSRERLWEIFGPAWAWPAQTLTYEEDRSSLAWHEEEMAAHRSFNYALLDEQETAILGCVYVDPPVRTGSDGDISWWVVDSLVGSETEHLIDAFVPQWIAAAWPFDQPRYLGRDISWPDWLALPRAKNGYPIELPTILTRLGEGASRSARLEGRLLVDNADCLYIEGHEGSRGIGLIWPAGFSARRTEMGDVEVLDADGEVVLRENDTFVAGGAGSAPRTKHPILRRFSHFFAIGRLSLP